MTYFAIPETSPRFGPAFTTLPRREVTPLVRLWGGQLLHEVEHLLGRSESFSDWLAGVAASGPLDRLPVQVVRAVVAAYKRRPDGIVMAWFPCCQLPMPEGFGSCPVCGAFQR